MNEQRLREELQHATPIDDGARGARARRGAGGLPGGRAGAARRRWAPALTVAVCTLAVAAVGLGHRAGRRRGALGARRARRSAARTRGRRSCACRAAGGCWSPRAPPAPGSSRSTARAGGSATTTAPRGRRTGASSWPGAAASCSPLEPDGSVRWSLARRGRIATARWSRGLRLPRRLRLGPLAARGQRRRHRRPSLRGGGRRRARLAARRPARARVRRPARPRARGGGRLGAQLWRSAQVDGATELAWSPDGRRLLVATRGRLVGARPPTGSCSRAVAAARVRRRRRRVGAARQADRDRAPTPQRERRRARRTRAAAPARVLFSGPGRFGRVAFSPDGRRLLVPWPEADQWLFLSPARGGHVGAVANIGRQFARGRAAGPFPDAVEWCCAGS